jgi:DNA-binding MarR family transcriptional regulator
MMYHDDTELTEATEATDLTDMELLEVVARETFRLFTRANRMVEALAARAGLDATEFRCMFLLSRQGPMPMRRLASLAGLTEDRITGVADRLERAGLLNRRRRPDDGQVLLHADDAAHRARIEPALRDLRESWYALVGRGCDDLGLVAVLLADGRRLTELVPSSRP